MFSLPQYYTSTCMGHQIDDLLVLSQFPRKQDDLQLQYWQQYYNHLLNELITFFRHLIQT